MTTETYLAAKGVSERLRDERCRAADREHMTAIEAADLAIRRRECSFADRDRAYAAASDARQYVYDEAYQDHQDRLAGPAKASFGQLILPLAATPTRRVPSPLWPPHDKLPTPRPSGPD